MPELLLDEPRLASCYVVAAQGISASGEGAGLPLLRLLFGDSSAEAQRKLCRQRSPKNERTAITTTTKPTM